MSSSFEPISLSLLGRLNKSVEFTRPPVRVVGLHSSSPLALYISQIRHNHISKHPMVLVLQSLSDCEDFIESLKFFEPGVETHLLPPFDVGAYSNLYPNHSVIARRLNWLYAAANARAGQIFVAPIEALLQKTLPYSIFSKATHIYEKNSDFGGAQLLNQLGYVPVPTVEDVGTYSLRGGILDVYSPGHPQPYRIELFGDFVETIRSFDPQTQMSVREEPRAIILPAREVLYSDENRQKIATSISKSCQGRDVAKEELQEILRSVSQGHPFYGVDFLLPYFYDRLDGPLDYFSQPIDLWLCDREQVLRTADELYRTLKSEYQSADKQILRVGYSELYLNFEQLVPADESRVIWVDKVHLAESSSAHATEDLCELKSNHVQDFTSGAHALGRDTEALTEYVKDRLARFHSQGYRVCVSSQTQNITNRLRILFEKANIQSHIMNRDQANWSEAFSNSSLHQVLIVERPLPEGFRIADEQIVFLRDEDIFSKRNVTRDVRREQIALEHTEALSFGELQSGDFVVHRTHGVGVYVGLKVMQINGAEAEFIELKYKDGDRLYLPVYRIGQLHKFSGPSSTQMIDKLGGTGWLKTQTKVRNQLRDVADKLLRLYAKRAQLHRPALMSPGKDYYQFENTFPYQETVDQLRAIESVEADLTSEKPMDRLVCGDVGFGKTEVALRAAFRAVENGRQVALIAPTTILTYQHFENFKKRFSSWPIVVRALNRFVSAKDVKQTIIDLKEGRVDIVIGTHRLLSKDVSFKNLGLLIIDEEQKFGVVHKEKLRHMRELVDTLALSATPIPRTLNMSLMGIRDLSIINTPPQDRLPTRTFVCKYDSETIRKAIENEIARGGQVFFLHNRVQSIDLVASELRQIVPSARMAVAHGQQNEELLEDTMLKFFKHELDVLVCTAIIESGMDIPKANTIIINDAHTLGLSQLYQLRGRVGRSKERAYCYLVLPADKRVDNHAIERLKVIQEHTALGSGLLVSQYDLELRGAGDILGEDQSGHINAVGYELYTELLDEVLREQKGESVGNDNLEPEINLRVPALLPDKYVPDIRMRLYYYKSLSNVRSHEDIDRIENELRDQFGPPPEPVLNLLGLMLIRKLCRDLGVKDISAGKNSVSLAFTERTPLPPNEVVRMTARDNKKFQITPDQRLKIRMNDLAWPRVVDELESLLKLCIVR